MKLENETQPFKMNLQLFNNNVDSIAGLDSLLDGNTNEQTPDQNTIPPADVPPTPEDVDPAEPGDGGDSNLDSPGEGETNPPDDGKQQQAKYNAAMANMRIQNTNLTRTIQELAKALGIQETDPNKLGDALLHMAQEKLAKEANVPVELYKELNQTKEQLAAIQYQQNQTIARENFMKVKELYGLDDKELMAFAHQLDNEGVNAITNPNVDLEYEYYKRNREAIEKKRIAAAVEEAIRNAQAAATHSTTPSNVDGGVQEPTPEAKINNVSALNDLMKDR